MLALQGPRAVEILGGLIEGEVPARFRHADATVAGVAALVCRTGYTGEDGVELLIEPGAATAVWDALLEAGASPAGLGARDTLRLEVCYPLYGNDLSADRTPIEAGLKWACALDTDFVGVERLREQAERRARRRSSLRSSSPGRASLAQIARSCTTATRWGRSRAVLFRPAWTSASGWPTSVPTSPSPGTDLTVDVRGKQRPARVSKKPLYEKGD